MYQHLTLHTPYLFTAFMIFSYHHKYILLNIENV